MKVGFKKARLEIIVLWDLNFNNKKDYQAIC